MKKVGIVGGMGPESTIPYYHDIVYGVQKRLGEKTFPNLTIESIDVFKVLGLCNDKKYDELFAYILAAIKNLENAGADFVVLSANTPHVIFDRLKENCNIPLISIVDTACQETINKGFMRVGLLGTIFTMKENFFKKPFADNSIDIVIPTDKEMEYLNDKISFELELGIVNKETLKGVQAIISRMKSENNIEAIILGCTELPLLLNDSVSPVPCLDTMKIHVDSIISYILN